MGFWDSDASHGPLAQESVSAFWQFAAVRRFVGVYAAEPWGSPALDLSVLVDSAAESSISWDESLSIAHLAALDASEASWEWPPHPVATPLAA